VPFKRKKKKIPDLSLPPCRLYSNVLRFKSSQNLAPKGRNKAFPVMKSIAKGWRLLLELARPSERSS
jgi:hypothetical protein